MNARPNASANMMTMSQKAISVRERMGRGIYG
jgi:hypothetical protein